MCRHCRWGSTVGLSPAPTRGPLLSLSSGLCHQGHCFCCHFPGTCTYLSCSCLFAQLLLLSPLASSSRQYELAGLSRYAFCSSAPKVKGGFSFSQQGDGGSGDSDCSRLFLTSALLPLPPWKLSPLPTSLHSPLNLWPAVAAPAPVFTSCYHTFSPRRTRRSAYSRCSGVWVPASSPTL